MHAGNVKFSTLNNERVSIYVIARMSLARFLYICNKNMRIIVVRVSKNAIHDIDRGVAVFSTFYEMNS